MEALREKVAKLEMKLEAVVDRMGVLEPFAREFEAKKKKAALNLEARKKQKTVREAAKSAKLRNLDCCCLEPKGKGSQYGRDPRLDVSIPAWAAKCVEFGKKNKPELFLEWLTWKWNCDTYRVKPIAKGHGYFRKFFGWSSASDSTHPVRQNLTARDIFGRCKNRTFTKTQADDFRNAPWWSWGSRVLNRVRSHVEEELEAWHDLPKHFRRVVGVLCGGHGQVQLRKELIWDPNDSADVLSKTYRIAMPTLNIAWIAVEKGFAAKEEPV